MFMRAFCTFLIATATLFSSSAFAAYYTWTAILPGFGNVTSTSPAGACSAVLAAYNQRNDGDLKLDGARQYNSINPHIYICDISSQKQNLKTSIQANRSGDSCPVDAPYDPQIASCAYQNCPVGQKRDSSGSCQVQTCEQTSSEAAFQKVYSETENQCVYNFNLTDKAEWCQYAAQAGWETLNEQSVTTNDPNNVQQAYESNNKCGFDVTKKDCTTRTDGTHLCKVTGKYNGEYDADATNDNTYNCTEGNCQAPPDQPQVQDPIPENTTDEKPCNYVSVGGQLQCQSSQTTHNEGTKNCGTVNGSWQCVPKAPTSNGIVIDSKVTTQTNADGSTTTTKTDTATQTKCTDIAVCVSETTTNTTTTITDANGNTTSTTGSCKGDNCPDVNTNPDGDGDGFGDCVGDECSEDGGDSQPPTDAELGEVKSFGESTSDFLVRARSAPIVDALSDIRAPSGGSCTQYQVETYMGTLEYDSHCILIEEKRSLITLIVKTLWALLATWIVLG